MGLSVSAHTVHGVATVALAGEVDLTTLDALTAAIAKAVGGDAVRHVVIDLTDLSYLDSTGISVLVHGRQQADQRGLGYRVVNASGIVERVLQITGVLGFLNGAATTGEPPAPGSGNSG